MSILPRGAFGGRYDPFPLELWDPFEDLPFRGTVKPPQLFFPPETTQFMGAKTEWKDTPEAHVLKAKLPGMRKDEVKVDLEDGRVLCIIGEKRMENEERTEKWYKVERSSGNFVKRFSLPENARADGIKATFDNGTLTVRIPKYDNRIPISHHCTSYSVLNNTYKFIMNKI